MIISQSKTEKSKFCIWKYAFPIWN